MKTDSLTSCLQGDAENVPQWVKDWPLTNIVSQLLKVTLLSYFLCIYYSNLWIWIHGLSCMVATVLCAPILFAGCGLTRLSCHGTLFSVFLLDHNENQPENQRKRKLQVHWYPRHLWFRELWGDYKSFFYCPPKVKLCSVALYTKKLILALINNFWTLLKVFSLSNKPV